MLYTGYLPHDVHGGLIELWSRLDNRLKLKDLLSRMEGRHTISSPKLLKLLSDHRTRFCNDHGILNWSSAKKSPSETDVKFLRKLNREQILMNTTMVSIILTTNCLPRYVVNNSIAYH